MKFLSLLFVLSLLLPANAIADSCSNIGRYTIIQDQVTGNAYVLDTVTGTFKHIKISNSIWQQE